VTVPVQRTKTEGASIGELALAEQGGTATERADGQLVVCALSILVQVQYDVAGAPSPVGIEVAEIHLATLVNSINDDLPLQISLFCTAG
jgi:hypothetical protein